MKTRFVPDLSNSLVFTASRAFGLVARYEPEVFERTKYIFTIPDLIRFWLTGDAHFEITNASGTSMLNINTKKFDQDLFKFFGIERWMAKLPPLANSTDHCGSISRKIASETGLVEGTPCSGGYSILRLPRCQQDWCTVTNLEL